VRVLVLCRAIASSLHEVSEPDVAEKKIHWWHEEIARLIQGVPRHPQAVAVSRLIQSIGIGPEPLLSILEANSSEKFINAEDQPTFEKHLLDDYGSRLSLCGRIISPDLPADTISSKTRRHIACGLGITDKLIHFRHLYHSGYPVFPDSDYERHQLTPEQFAHPDFESSAYNLLKEQRVTAAQHLRDSLSTAEPAVPAAVIRLIKLRLAQMELWETKRINPYHTYATLTPLRKAWLTLFSRGSTVRRSTRE